MAVFGTDKAPQLGDVSDWSNASKGFRDRSVASLVEGAAGVVDAANEGVEAYVDNDIQTQLEEGVATIETDIGLRPLDDEASVPEGLQRQFQRFQNFFDAAETARGPGASQTYFKRLDTLVRDVRNQYPGFAPEIDKKIQQITGFDPHNRLISSIFAKAEENSRTAQEAEREWLRFSNSDDFVAVYGGAAQLRPQDFATPEQRRQAMAKVNNIRGQRLQLAAQKELTSADQTANTVTANQAASLASTELFSGFMETIGKIDPEQKSSPENKKVIGDLLLQFKNQAFTKLNNTVSEFNIPLEEKEKIIAAGMKPFEFFEEQIMGDKVTLAARHANMHKARTDSAINALDTLYPASVIERVVKDFPDAESYLEKLAPMDDTHWTSQFNQRVFLDIALGNSRMDQAVDVAKGSNRPEAEKNKSITDITKTSKEAILNPTTPEDTRLKLCGGFFNRSCLTNVMDKLDSGGLDYFNYWTPPEITDQISSMGDDRLSSDYITGLANVFRTNDFLKEVNSINNQLATTGQTLTFKDGAVVLTIPEKSAPISAAQKKFRERKEGLSRASLNKLNMAVKNVYYGLQTLEGGDPTEAILLGLQGAGLQIKLDEPEGETKGAN